MSSFKSSDSSFDPLDYYKKLTLCLANKKNCKINISRVPGGKELMENKRLPHRITEEYLQLQFLAKYNEKKALELQQKEHQQIQPAPPLVQMNPAKKNPLNFDFKHNALMKDGKRRKEDETYLNLPPSYFQSTNIPDLAIFKVPDAPPPPPKKPRNEAPESLSNFTLDSLFSGNFKPPKTSTPIEQPKEAAEKPKAIISDPCEILNLIKQSKAKEASEKSKKDQNDPKMKSFVELIDAIAKKIDAVCFADIEDQMLEILNKLNTMHEIASQSPRQSLLCSGSSTKITRPLPVFYDKNEAEENHENAPRIDTLQLESFFNKSGFTEHAASSNINNFEEVSASSPAPSFNFENGFDISTATNDYLFETTQRTPFENDLSAINFGNDTILMTQRGRISDAMDFNWLEDVFTTLDLKWPDATSDTIFQSPPNRLSLRRKYAEARFQRQTFEDDDDDEGIIDDKNSNDDSLWTNQTIFTVNNDRDSVFDTSFDLF